jgi:hypothetical protein
MRVLANVVDVSNPTYLTHSASDLYRLSVKSIKNFSNLRRRFERMK